MEHKVASLETQIALMQSDIDIIKGKHPELPKWLKTSAIAILIAMFGQIMTSVWWASSITTTVTHMDKEVQQNTEFRLDWPQLHQEVVVGLTEIKTQYRAVDEKLQDIKSKMKFVGRNGKEN